MENEIKYCIGMGVHFGFNGDYDPGQVVAISKAGRIITVRLFTPYNFRDWGPTEDCRDCDFEPSVWIIRHYFTLRKDGSYRERGSQSYCLGVGMCYARNPCI